MPWIASTYPIPHATLAELCSSIAPPRGDICSDRVTLVCVLLGLSFGLALLVRGQAREQTGCVDRAREQTGCVDRLASGRE